MFLQFVFDWSSAGGLARQKYVLPERKANERRVEAGAGEQREGVICTVSRFAAPENIEGKYRIFGKLAYICSQLNREDEEGAGSPLFFLITYHV
jgi:hypothetical protein